MEINPSHVGVSMRVAMFVTVMRIGAVVMASVSFVEKNDPHDVHKETSDAYRKYA